MPSNHLTPDRTGPGRQPAPAAPAVAGAALDPSDHVPLQHLYKTGGWTRQERLRILWYRLRLTIQEMNYATRRLAELQTRLP
jgi:hypothetical protein